MTKTKTLPVLVTLLLGAAALGLTATSGTDKAAAVFEGKSLIRPKGYREWVFVGSSLGLAYSQNPGQSAGPGSDLYNNVYINPSSSLNFIRC